MRAFLLAFVALHAVLGQSLDSLTRKYGNPVSETFAVLTDIGVKVRRTTDGSVTEMIILPLRADSLVESRSISFSEETGNEVLKELVPSSTRGKLLGAGFVNAVCLPENDCAGSFESYEKVGIYYNSAAKAGQLCYISIHFKR